MKLVISNTDIHQDAEGRFSLNDLHAAAVSSGVTKDIRPNEWLALEQTKGLSEILITEKAGNKPIESKAGRYGGTYVAKELVYAYAMWISPKFHLQVIRAYDQVVTKKPSLVQPAKEFRAMYGIARLIGCDKNAAAISANQAVATFTGANMLQLLGHTHIEAQDQSAQYFTPTELGKIIGAPARGVNLLLAEAGMQLKRGEVWEVTDAGRAFARLYDTGKKHGSGVPVTQIKWSTAVLPLLGEAKEAA